MKAQILKINRQITEGTNQYGAWKLLSVNILIDGKESKVGIFSSETTPIQEGWEYGGALNPPSKPGQDWTFQIDPKVEPCRITIKGEVEQAKKAIDAESPQPHKPPAPPEAKTRDESIREASDNKNEVIMRTCAFNGARDIVVAMIGISLPGNHMNEIRWGDDAISIVPYIKTLADEFYQLMAGKK